MQGKWRFMETVSTPWGAARVVALGTGDAAGEVLVVHPPAWLNATGRVALWERLGRLPGKAGFHRFWPMEVLGDQEGQNGG